MYPGPRYVRGFRTPHPGGDLLKGGAGGRSLIDRRAEENGVSEASSPYNENVGFMGYNVLAGGVLTGKYRAAPAVPDDPNNDRARCGPDGSESASHRTDRVVSSAVLRRRLRQTGAGSILAKSTKVRLFARKTLRRGVRLTRPSCSPGVNWGNSRLRRRKGFFRSAHPKRPTHEPATERR